MRRIKKRKRIEFNQFNTFNQCIKWLIHVITSLNFTTSIIVLNSTYIEFNQIITKDRSTTQEKDQTKENATQKRKGSPRKEEYRQKGKDQTNKENIQQIIKMIKTNWIELNQFNTSDKFIKVLINSIN